MPQGKTMRGALGLTALGAEAKGGEAPPALARLLACRARAEQELAWRDFLECYSRLLLRVAHDLGGNHDSVMDRYTYVVEWLAKDDLARLRAYVPDGRTRFTTWLVIVARRLCLDQHRRRYGEPSKEPMEERARAARRRLADLMGEPIDLSPHSGPAEDSPEWQLRLKEQHEALDRALDQLEPADRLLLKLRFEFDLPAREVANILKYPTVFHVYRREKQVLKALRASLDRRGITGVDA